MKDIAFSLLDIQELVCLYFNFLSLIVTYSSQFTWQGHRKLPWAMSKDEPLLSNCPLETAEPSRNYARVPGYKKKYKKKTRKRREKKRKMNCVENQYARVRRCKITSTLGLLVRGDPQNEGLRGLQPRALGSKLDYFHAGITSTRLHRPWPLRWVLGQGSLLPLSQGEAFSFYWYPDKSAKDNSANDTSAKPTVRMPTVRKGQQCECQQCECDSGANASSANATAVRKTILRTVQNRALSWDNLI